MLLASRLRLPDDTGALLWDLDGVVLDTLSLEVGIVQDLLAEHVPAVAPVDREAVRRAFPHTIPVFWRLLLEGAGAEPDDALVRTLTDALEDARTTGAPAVLPGVRELLDAAAAAGLAVAVVSNNPVAHIEELLDHAGLRSAFAHVVGNDQGLPGKPAPDMYLAGAEAVGLAPARCVALEDSLLGAAAARAAGCHVVGVATGAATFGELEASADVDRAFLAFTPSTAVLAPGDVTAKSLRSPNEFVSHMLEHIAWRTGCSFTLAWACNDWGWLGEAVGAQLGPLLDGPQATSRALGLIDDGSCEVTLTRGGDWTTLNGVGPVDAERFVGLRVEQLAAGGALVEILRGLGAACGLGITIDVASVEDPHHTWEAIFRAVGVALRGLSDTLRAHADGTGSTVVPNDGRRAQAGYGLRVEAASPEAVRVVRTTAESVCTADVALAGGPLTLTLATSPSVSCDGLIDLVGRLGMAAGLGGTIDFSALELSSSHVVAEDVGMTLGAAVKELATARMDAFGIEGAGSSLGAAPGEPIRVGISWEGRKFLQLVPLGWTREALRDQLIGGTLASGLFSEDLDDFLDGFVGGMGVSVVVHWEPVTDLDAAWVLVFTGLGAALAELLAPNHAKRALIAGVKATLA
ncbi:HAD family phosphatase [Paraconexibacter antarcticus]|uniref:HAD family phosphatase n=1 Tax=Paraconexibacter antarcticus TaxID=2949664 RepID=A0ABY5DXP6_9ACTN|nr:HAD-IA family hydrolase [Paraconexibacter antarcticus]UTI65911.1 HAD family phosphatase [Paraconexibacter antarcticus]